MKYIHTIFIIECNLLGFLVLPVNQLIMSIKLIVYVFQISSNMNIMVINLDIFSIINYIFLPLF